MMRFIFFIIIKLLLVGNISTQVIVMGHMFAEIVESASTNIGNICSLNDKEYKKIHIEDNVDNLPKIVNIKNDIDLIINSDLIDKSNSLLNIKTKNVENNQCDVMIFYN